MNLFSPSHFSQFKTNRNIRFTSTDKKEMKCLFSSISTLTVTIILLLSTTLTVQSNVLTDCWEAWSRCSGWSESMTGILWKDCDTHCKRKVFDFYGIFGHGNRNNNTTPIKSRKVLGTFSFLIIALCFNRVMSPYHHTLVGETLFYSGVAWIPYCLLLLYLCHEHNIRHRFPQNLILLFLSLGAIVRCTWYLFYDPYGPQPVGIILNRIAILMQFSALSVLLMMWSRALKITQNIDKINTINPAPQTAAERLEAMKIANEQSLTNLKNIKSQNCYMYITIIINFLVWFVTLATIALNRYDGWYNVNLVILSLLCLLEGFFTLGVGIRTSIKLRVELQPVYQSNTILNNQYDANNIAASRKNQFDMTCPKYTCGCGIIMLCKFIFGSSNNNNKYRGLQMQREVLKTLLSVSAIICFFFTIRSFGLLYHPVVEGYGHSSEGSNIINQMMYPLFMYTFPETLPNVAIAIGISPPSGIMRRYFMPFVARVLCLESCGWYNNSLYSGGYFPESNGSTSGSRENSLHGRPKTQGKENEIDERQSSSDLTTTPGIIDDSTSESSSQTGKKSTFSFFSFLWGRKQTKAIDDSRSVASSHTHYSVNKILKHGTIHGETQGTTIKPNNPLHYDSHGMFDTDDVIEYDGDNYAHNDSLTSNITTTTSLHSNRSSNMQSFSITRPVPIDDISRKKSLNSLSQSGHQRSQMASSTDSDFKIGSYGLASSAGSGINGSTGWRMYSTDELSKFRKESEDYQELVYCVNSFHTNSRQNSANTTSTLGSGFSHNNREGNGVGETGGDDEENQANNNNNNNDGNGIHRSSRIGFFGSLFRNSNTSNSSNVKK